MDFKTAIEHYQNRTASEEERLLVEEELDKFLLLEALVREDAPAGMPPEQEESADFQVIRRKLRNETVQTSAADDQHLGSLHRPGLVHLERKIV